MHLRAPGLRLLRERPEPHVLRGEEVAPIGDRPRQRDRDVVHGGPHDVQMVGPGVRDNAHSSLRYHVLADPLQVGPDGHALEDQRPGALPPRPPHDAQLLPDVGRSRSGDRLLGSVGMDVPGRGAGGLGRRPDAAGTQTGGNEPRHGRLAAGTVHVDSDGNSTEVREVQPVFHDAVDQKCHGKKEHQRHASVPPQAR